MNTNTVLFEGTVMDAYESDLDFENLHEVININYPLPPINTYKIEYNEETGEVEKHFDGISDTGWIQIILPVFNGLKPGDKIKVIKCS